MNAKNDSVPPIRRSLLRPAELRHLLIMFRGVKSGDLTLKVYQCRAHATGADIDGKEQIFCSWGHRNFLIGKIIQTFLKALQTLSRTAVVAEGCFVSYLSDSKPHAPSNPIAGLSGERRPRKGIHESADYSSAIVFHRLWLRS